MTDTVERTFDWRPRHDERSRDYPIRTVAPAEPVRRMWSPPSQPLDQGREGACTGFAWVHEALATPVRVDTARVAALVAPAWSRDPQVLAQQVYRAAQRIDEWAGESYEGTSVLASAKVMQRLGLLREYRWAFGVRDVALALYRGPVVLGINWYVSMYDAPGGVVGVSGKLAGGHCILCTGFDPKAPKLGGRPGFAVFNSWGPDWGENGVAWIRYDDLGDLLSQRGEACVPFRRSHGR